MQFSNILPHKPTRTFAISQSLGTQVHLEWAKHDLGKITDREIPSWVNGAIYGTVIIFWSFTIPQILFQYLPPGYGAILLNQPVDTRYEFELLTNATVTIAGSTGAPSSSTAS